MTKFSTRLNGTFLHMLRLTSVGWFMTHSKVGNPIWRSCVTVEQTIGISV